MRCAIYGGRNMLRLGSFKVTVFVGALWFVSPAFAEIDLSGYLSFEPRVFFDSPLYPQQPPAGLSLSAAVAPEFQLQWNAGNDGLVFSPYLLWDEYDQNRTHGDLREAYWYHTNGDWSWQVGLGRVFWGVTESRHLVDVINQTDQVVDIDGEDKLGQPMVLVERWTPVGTFGVFVMPWFRERTFPAADARLRGKLPIDTANAEYQSGAGQRRLDLALRWSNAMGSWDLGLSAFHGTSREPRLLPRFDADHGPELVPRYEVMSQLGADLQYTEGAWLWKLEAIGVSGLGKTFLAFVAGFEYTVFNLGGRGIDVGLLAEYLYDGRDATAPPTVYANDGFAGFRVAFNDSQDSTILGGAYLDGNETFAIVEAQRRLGDAWVLAVDARLFLKIDRADPVLGGIRNDSYITLSLARFL